MCKSLGVISLNLGGHWLAEDGSEVLGGGLAGVAEVGRATAEPPPPAPDDVAFLDLLTGLTERQRIAVTLRYVDDLSEAEIAAVLGCRPGTVKSTLHRAIKLLRARMEGES